MTMVGSASGAEEVAVFGGGAGCCSKSGAMINVKHPRNTNRPTHGMHCLMPEAWHKARQMPRESLSAARLVLARKTAGIRWRIFNFRIAARTPFERLKPAFAQP